MNLQLFYKDKKYCRSVIANFSVFATIWLQPAAPGLINIQINYIVISSVVDLNFKNFLRNMLFKISYRSPPIPCFKDHICKPFLIDHFR